MSNVSQRIAALSPAKYELLLRQLRTRKRVSQSTASSWLIFPNPNPRARLRLFCFPYGGGGASAYLTWSDYLPPDVEVCIIQLPGRENRLMEMPFTHLSPIIQTLVSILRPYMEVPFAFYGHSMGALIAFELARELRKTNVLNLVHLFVAAYRAPHLPTPLPPFSELESSDSALIDLAYSRGGIPETILQDAEMLRELLPTFLADIHIVKSYTFSTEEPLDSPISAFGGQQDSWVSYDNLAAWSVHTRSSFSLQIFSGNHLFLHSERAPLLQAISEALIPLLSSVIGTTGDSHHS